MSNTATPSLTDLLASVEAAYARGDYATAEALDAELEAASDEVFAEVGLAGTTVTAGPFTYVYVDPTA